MSESKSAPSADDLGRQTKILEMGWRQFLAEHPELDTESLSRMQCPHCGNKVNSGYDTCGTCNKSDLVWISVDLKYCQEEMIQAEHSGDFWDFRQEKWVGPCIRGTEDIHQKYWNLKADAENKLREWKLKLAEDRKGACFVATACFGDEQHPTVLGLRRFRDQVLQDRSLGRSFIAWYYRNGPGLANTLDYIPWIYPLLRVTLSLGLKVLQLRYAKIR